MIIYGSKVLSSSLKAGKFNCPNCRREQTYQLKNYTRFFHLFFIPLLKIKELGEEVQCVFCQTSYVPGSVLPPEEYEAKNQLINRTGETSSSLLGATPADFSKRVGSFVLDFIIISVFVTLITAVFKSSTISIIFVPFVYYMACDLLLKGSSIGKIILSLKVVDYNEEQGVLPFYLILRNLLKCVSVCVPPLLLVAYFNQDKRALHDLAAQTIVIDK